MFSSHLNRPGFISEIKSMLSELYQYGATPEDLKAQTAGEHVGQILAAKLSDMEVIFEAFGSLRRRNISRWRNFLMCSARWRTSLHF